MDLSGLSGKFRGNVYRIIESQEKVASMNLVDTLDEQALLENLIEKTKPIISEKKQRHYLIQTPFRYPPLQHGSRFGSRFEPSIFYAGKTLQSALCESAFYSFYFMSRSTLQYENAIINHKASFSVEIQNDHHIDLTQISNPDIKQKLIHKSDYQFTQSIGKQFRKESVSSFSYFSARCDKQVNIGVFDIYSIVGEPKNYHHWEVKQTSQDIVFFCRMNPKLNQSFNVEHFLVDGVFPKPSN